MQLSASSSIPSSSSKRPNAWQKHGIINPRGRRLSLISILPFTACD
jgi:hypothetical protein